MRRLVGLLCLFFLLGIGSAQDGTLRVVVRDERAHPIQAIARFYRQIYDFCKPWDTFTLSSWHSLFLSYARELGREPSLMEWCEWLVKRGVLYRLIKLPIHIIAGQVSEVTVRLEPKS